LRYYRTTGLMVTQMQELVRRVNNALDKPWDKHTGRPKSLRLYRAVEAACMYLRQNATQEFIGDARDTSQPTISRYTAALVPLVKAVLEEFVPSAADAIEVVKGRVVLVDGTLTPCWSYEEHQELWNKKHATTGFNAQLISLLDGTAVWISGPLPGKTHDAKAFKETGAADILKEAGGGFGDKGYQGTGLVTPKKKPQGGELTLSDKDYNSQISSFRAPVERLVAHFKNWKMLHTDYRRPYRTYHETFGAARALFFFSITWGFE
jgi:DDE superfamily endonuclease